jgi:hypothetical protein
LARKDILSQQFANRHGEQHVALVHTGISFLSDWCRERSH